MGPIRIGFVVLLAASPALALASESEPRRADAPAQRVRVVAGPEYKTGALRQWALGKHYRDLWTTPIEVEVLSLATEAGGLTPKEKGGSMETKSLKLRAGDGREFRFRSVNKDPVKILSPELRVGPVEDIVRDQIRAQLPAGALPVAYLAQAGGLLHVTPRLFVMPDDPALGEFRKEFAGLLGMLEENPQTKAPATAGLEDFDEMEDWDDLLKLLDKSPRDRVDTRAFLKARLFDLWIGDWDRHEKQWDWARRRGTTEWYPIPKDRDHAFSDFDGAVLAIARQRQPRLVRFQGSYPPMFGMGWNSRFLDRRLLEEAAWPLWAEVAAELQHEMTDEVIRGAIATLPRAYQEVGGARLAATLQERRERLPNAARALYRMLSEDAEVQATDADDELEIVYPAERDHSVELRLSSVEADGSRKLTYFRRLYRADETDEVRVYLRGGADRVVSTGPPAAGIKVRVIGGPGDDVLDDSAAGHTVFYDHEGENRVIKGPGTRVDRKPYTVPLDKFEQPMIDWGGLTFPIVTADAGGDLGVLVGLGLRHEGYGFRKDPFASRYTFTVGYATAQRGFRADFLGELNRTGRGRKWEIFGRASQIELVRFYGFGNETPAIAASPFYRADQGLLLFQPRYHRGSDRAGLWLGPVAKFSHVDPGQDRFLGLTRPYGVGDFGQVGLGASVVADTRRQPTGLETGLRLSLNGNYYPKAWSVQESFAETHGDVSVYLTAPMRFRPTLALRAGGRQLFGDQFPFYEAAFVGGPETVRGLSRNRYAGERAAFGNAELRLGLGELKVIVPIGLGVFALADAGRVWVGGQQSDQWHTGVGGGVWLSLNKPQYLVSLSVAQDETGTRRVYFQGGLSF